MTPYRVNPQPDLTPTRWQRWRCRWLDIHTYDVIGPCLGAFSPTYDVVRCRVCPHADYRHRPTGKTDLNEYAPLACDCETCKKVWGYK